MSKYVQSFSAAFPANSDNTAQVFLTPVNDSSKRLIQLNSEITEGAAVTSLIVDYII